MSTEKAVIKVRRLEVSAAQSTLFTIEIDGLKMGRISHNRELALEIVPGKHTITAKMDWDSSDPIEFDIQPGETALFECDWDRRMFAKNMRLERVEG